MRSRLASLMISITFIIIVAVFILIGILFWNSFVKLETYIEPQNLTTVIPETSNTIDEDIKTPEIIENPFEGIKDSNSKKEIEEIDYSNVEINKYFYNQLEDYSKVIYRAFETNKENMKTGTYTIELGSSFSSLLHQTDGQDKLGTYYQSAIEAYTYDNPDVFYLSPNKMYLNIETITKGSNVTYNVFINCGKQPNYLIDEFSNKDQINIAIERIEQIRDNILLNKTNDTYRNIKMVHDYLIENTQYDTTVSKENIYNIYGAMVNKTSVCEGYARSFKYLMDALEIPCIVVIGKGTNSEGVTENHAWNYVELDENWYAVDCTWDDPVSSTGWVSQKSKTKYFLKGSNQISQDHTSSGQFTQNGKVFTYPKLNTIDYE